jgi:hypothetical protein
MREKVAFCERPVFLLPNPPSVFSSCMEELSVGHSLSQESLLKSYAIPTSDHRLSALSGFSIWSGLTWREKKKCGNSQTKYFVEYRSKKIFVATKRFYFCVPQNDGKKNCHTSFFGRCGDFPKTGSLTWITFFICHAWLLPGGQKCLPVKPSLL